MLNLLIKEAIDHSLKDTSLQKIILKQLAFDNANKNCQAIIRPIKKQKRVIKYLKAYKNVEIFVGILEARKRISITNLADSRKLKPGLVMENAEFSTESSKSRGIARLHQLLELGTIEKEEVGP